MEKVGYAKRDLFVSRVKNAKASQEEAKEQFASALDRFRAVLGSPGGSLESKYTALKSSLEKSETRAKAVRDRIASVEDVSGALFAEWKGEIKGYSNASLREQSEEKLQETKEQYKVLLGAMKRAESKLEPVLVPLRDNVLFLKHNLNARAIGNLRAELGSIESNVSTLMADLDRSIRESDEFIRQLDQ